MGAREGWPEIADFNDANIRRGLAGQSWSLEHQELVLDRGSGPECAWLDLHYVPVRDENSDPAGVMVFVSEITEQVRLAAHKAEADERLELALSAGRGVGAWDWDIADDIVRADERFARLYGVDPVVAREGAPSKSSSAPFIPRTFPGSRRRLPGPLKHAPPSARSIGSSSRMDQRFGSLQKVGASWTPLDGCAASLASASTSANASRSKLDRPLCSGCMTRSRLWKIRRKCRPRPPASSLTP
ncbi:hypothetical protein V8F63_15525 [Brevundimonas sp. LF-1]|uniref:hypothetical protein n=1 Tax=Brevundimonas sp. LF-1 TaxID=3126100 RepID=UPI0030E15745